MFEGVTESTERAASESAILPVPHRTGGARAKCQGGPPPSHVVVAHSSGVERRLIAAFLRERGCKVTELSNGIELLMHLADGCAGKEGVFLPDLVIADEELRSYSGIDILLHSRNCHLDTPFIILTREYDEESAQLVRAARGASLLPLPLSMGDLFSIVDFFLDERACLDHSAA